MEKESLLFSNQDLKAMIMPLFLEQLLIALVGIADVFVVGFVGEAAVSGVSLVNSFNTIFLNLFVALASGGAVVISQYIGRQENIRAGEAATQLLTASVLFSIAISIIVLFANTSLMRLMFGRVEDEVMDACVTYLRISAYSYPALAIYNAGAALYRSFGKTRTTMYLSVAANVINVVGNCIGVFGFRAGVAGVAWPSLISRTFSAVVITILCFSYRNPVQYRKAWMLRLDRDLQKRILRIAVPNGVMSKKNPKTYNHYVPQFYLKNFSGNNSIGRYNFDRKEFVNEAAIRNTAGRDFLYGKNSDLEDWFQDLEGVWATTIRNILLYEKFPMDSIEYTYLLLFVYLSDVRIAEIADEFKRTKLEEGKNVARILAHHGKIEISDEFIKNLDVQIDRPNLSYIQGTGKMLSIISDLCPLIIVNESKIGFITSDVPVVKYNQWFLERGYRHPFGFGHMGCQCFVPLSAKICFCLYDDIIYKNQFGNKGRIRLYDEKDVEELNRLFMLNSYAEIYYRKNEEEWVRKNVREKVAEEKDEWILGNPQIGYLQKISRRSVYDIVKLPMFKINSFFKTAPFPYSDEVGPLRKAVYEKMDEDIKFKL